MISVPSSLTSTLASATASAIGSAVRLYKREGIDSVRLAVHKLHIQTDLELIGALVCELATKEGDHTVSVKIAIMHLSDSLSALSKEMQKLGDEMQAHDSKWFSKWRSFVCDVSTIQGMKSDVDHHFERLTKVMTMNV